MTGHFITFEGVEGAGKTTQCRLLIADLQAAGVDAILVREPGGTPLGEAIRDILLQSEGSVTAEAELLLFLAARADHTARVIRPALERGVWVVCDRYADSTVAYQGYGRGLHLDTVRRMNAFATGGLLPDVTFVLDVPAALGLSRQKERNRMEREEIAFHERVRNGYLQEASEDPKRFCVLPGEEEPLRVQERVRQELVRRGWLAA